MGRKAFLFGSELKALEAHPFFISEIDSEALSLQTRHGYVPSPFSIYEGVKKLSPGHYITISYDEMKAGQLGEQKTYWSFEALINGSAKDPWKGTFLEASTELEDLISMAIESQSISDVPLGAFLSGGVDSSLIVALMQRQNSTPIKTFCIGFEDKQYDEAPYANQIAKHLGTEHTEFYVTAKKAMSVIPKLPELYDEPFGDPRRYQLF